ncbi:ATP-binding protein [Mesorhizobium sp. M0500]|uniref:YobI family P-loop NTPase n=1 Tax=Mesorhizobium sp. M0500 TaxID=2956953 RepID=UPI003338D07E
MNESAGGQSKFIDLAPTDKADEAGVYSDALLYATNNPRVSNIALTGPYGSGKSSIIKSFLKKYKRPILQISLAAFLPEATATGGEVSKQEIERSILQQMLYGADANKLPLSRFKRIQSPSRWSIFTSLYIIFGLFACWNLLQNREKIINGEYLLPLAASNWFNLTCFAVGVSFLWLALHHFYVASFGVSLKSISLKDIEITPEAVNQESILNRHLDEIIYFFQSTKYDLVVIEDLDRFNNSEIFVTLREINSLVNENSGVKRTIRFLYALRDDMFVNTDRTKFFEFIIPVIPIINSSNSIDKVLEQGKRLSLDNRLDRQFLREVSRYLNDLRLIQNIFNEYAIYVANLETGGENVLDANKLLAVLIYKNVFPRDFENLHRGKGDLARILDRHHEFIADGEAEYRAKISSLEEQVDNADRQVPSDLQELRRIYAMALIEKLPTSVSHIGVNEQNLIELSSLAKHDSLEQIIEAPQVTYRLHQTYPQRLNIAGFQAEIDPLRTYKQRRGEIERRAVGFKNAASKNINDLRSKVSVLRIAKFNEIIRLNAKAAEDLFEAFGDNRELARFLVFEGYLDDTYYQYTSLFHSGRLSPNDNKFLIQIRGFVSPEPGFQIDNPNEVIAAMRDDDFRQGYVLNVNIVDCLLSDSSAYTLQTANLFEFIESDFEKCEAFFTTYYATGAKVSALVSGLVETWAGFVPAAIGTPRNLSHVAQIIAHLPARALEALPGKYPDISGFVSVNLPQILALGIDFEPARLKYLGIEIADLPAIEGFAGIARFLFEEGLYSLTIDNVEFIFRAVMGLGDPHHLRTQHYTTVLKTANAALISRIERNFGDYLKDIILELEENSQESIPAILSVIAREEIDLGDLSTFLEKQSALIPSLEQAPTRLHALLFQFAKVEASWDNCLAFLASGNFDANSLTAYLNTKPTLAVLSQHAIPNDEKASTLRSFLIENDALQDAVYRTYVQGLPRHFSKFPENLGAGKLQIVIEEGKVTFSHANLSFLEANSDLQVLFVTKNIEQYLDNESTFAVDDEFREKLLASDVRDDHKLAIVRSMDLTLLASLPSRAGAVGPILDRTGADMSVLDTGSARAIVVNSAPISVQISLFNKCKSILGDGDVREILALLPEPFSDIKTGYSTPRIKKTEGNIELVKWLDSRDIISSWREALFSDEIRINLYRR